MACGTGKTLVAFWVMERLKARRTLVLLPSLSLLGQTLREWTANASPDRSDSPGSFAQDDTVAEGDHLVSRASDLAVPVTTSPGEIVTFLEGEGPAVIFATYQSSPRIAEAVEHMQSPST